MDTLWVKVKAVQTTALATRLVTTKEKGVLQMKIKQIVEVNGVQIEKGSCTVAFRLWFNDARQPVEVTHTRLYELITNATTVKEADNGTGSLFCKLDYNGVIQIKAYEIRREEE